MNTQKGSDLLSLHRDLLSQWEKGVNELLVNYLSSGDVERQVQLLALPTKLKRSYGKVLDRLPATKGDLVSLEERLKAIEDLLARVVQVLEPKVEEPKAPTTMTPAPRTRRYKAPKTAKP